MQNHRIKILGLLVLSVVSAQAQQVGGTIKGVLTDESGALIPAAAMVLSGNGVKRPGQTQADGSYSFTSLPAGDYTVSVSLAGFAPYSKVVKLESGAAVQVPIQLSVSASKQEVTVQADSGPSVSVEADKNATALVLKDADLQALPDDPDDLSDALQALAGPGAGPNGGQIYVDGFSGGQLPPKASIREIRINQNPFSAEYDRLGFGRIEILTRPGTDKLRGSLALMDGDAVLNSRNPFSDIKPDYSSRMWMGNLGGSIGKKTSFFMDFMRRDVKDNSVIVAQYFDPKTLTQSSINTSVVSPSSFMVIAPRFDFALTSNHTLTVRVEERLNSRDNAGIGATRLPAPYSDLAYNTTGDGQNIMLSETGILSSRIVNETRFQFFRNYNATPGNLLPQINVAGAFVTGGNGLGNSNSLSRHLELQNNTSVAHGAHTIRFGVRVRRDSDQNTQMAGFNGTYTFLGGPAPLLNAANQIVYDASGNAETAVLTSLQQYERNVLLSQAGLSQSDIQLLGGGPSRFTIQNGQSYISGLRWDAGPFIQDDWRMRPNFTVNFGLRYEVQTLLAGHGDLAPRIGFAWAPGSSRNGSRKTVIRGGLGLFYDRVNQGLFETAALNNGVNQLQYTVYNPTSYPNVPSLSALTAGQNTIVRVDPNLRSSYSMQTALGVERQLPRNTTVALTYTFNRAIHLSQSVPVNAPLPGSFNPQLPLSADNGLFPLGYSAGTIFQNESGGLMSQHMLMMNFNTRFSRRVSLFGNYSLGYAKDLPSSPSDPYNFAADWGRSSFERRHSFQLVGNVVGPAGIQLSPFVTMRSGQPYDLLAGTDLFGDNLTNARPVFLSTAACGSVVRTGDSVCSPYGTFTSNYNVANPGSLVPRNYLTMPGLVSVNLRLSRTFGFGMRHKNAAVAQPGGMPSPGMMGLGGGARGPGGPGGGGPPGGPGGMGGPGMGGPGGMGGMGGGSSEHPYSATFSVSFENLLNHLNPGGYQGVITSPYFLQPTSVNTGFGGGGPGGGGPGGPGGFGGAANNRRVQLGVRFSF